MVSLGSKCLLKKIKSEISTISERSERIVEISDLIFFSKLFEPNLTIYNPEINVMANLKSSISDEFPQIFV